MIYRIDDESNYKLNIKSNINSQSYLRINGLYKAYGTGYNFIEFFTNSSNNLFICMKLDFADVYIGENFSEQDQEELKDFLYLKCNEILSEFPIDKINTNDILKLNTGKNYVITNPIFDRVCVINVSNEISECYKVAKEVFSSSINETTYQTWYTDLSHRVRHGVSKAYTIENKSTAIVYATEEDVVLISYLGTISKYRNQGYAKFIIDYIARELNAKKIILQSQDETSDKFYEKLGFVQYGNYYNYYFKT